MGKKEQLNVQAIPGQPTQQVTKFYHHGVASAPHIHFEKDCAEMAREGWRLTFAANVGNAALNSLIVAIYQK